MFRKSCLRIFTLRKLLIVSLFSPLIINGQDTLTLMHYNILNYGGYNSYCTELNNSTAFKNIQLRKIIPFVMPDILTVNEIVPENTTVQMLLDSVLNTNGIIHYKKTDLTNVAGSSIVNMLFYNSDKIAVKSQYPITNSVRDINVYNLYYLSPELVIGDTVFFKYIVMHLKAGNTASDASERAMMTATLMLHLSSLGYTGNTFVSGDFNVYTSSEGCFQNLINYANTSVRFYDPINQIGDWNNNATFASVHTQSTHTNSNGCISSGGMDDRFDYIMASSSIMNGYYGIQYIPDSYNALGQDGLRFNQNINNPTNTVVPPDIADALYNNSDHLPIYMKVFIRHDQSGLSSENKLNNIKVVSPAQGKIDVNLLLDKPNYYTFKLINLLGELIFSKQFYFKEGNNTLEIPIDNINKGMFVLQLSDLQGRFFAQKIILL